MKRWYLTSMLDIGRKLFAKIHKQKHQAHHNHDIHFLARDTPRFLKRCYFPDEMIDQLHLSEFARILNRITNPYHIIN